MDHNDENKENQSLDQPEEEKKIEEELPSTVKQETSEEEQPKQEPMVNAQYESTPVQKEPVKHKKSGGGGRGFIGGLFGGLISAAIVLLLITSNIIPINNTNTGNSSTTATAQDDNSTADIVKTFATGDADEASSIQGVSEAVVGVINMQQQNVWTDSQDAGSGSGIIYKKENGKAYVVTNHHVVEGAKEVDVVLNDDERIKAKVLGSDQLTDLAVLEIDGDKIKTVANMGSSKDMKIAEEVVAIGNPLGMDFANTVTKGIISGLNRSIKIDTNGDNQPDWVTEVIQTDAAINPGNSGGALVNTKGEVIGINSMKIARDAVEGIGFAIPVDTAIPIMNQLEKDGEITRPLIGISTASLNQVPPQYQNKITLPKEVEGGMVIADVQTGSAADKAGLEQFDVITKINGEEITSILELRKYLYSETKVGDTIEVEYYRNGKLEKAKVALQEKDKD